MPGDAPTIECRHCQYTVEIDLDRRSDYPGWYLLMPDGSTISFLPVYLAESDSFTRSYDAVCPECDPECDLMRCAWCDCWVDEDYEPGCRMANGDLVCLSCYEEFGFYCDDCGEQYNRDYGCNVDDERQVCEGCSDDYFYCECCGYYTNRDNARYLDDFLDDLDEDERDQVSMTYDAMCTYCADDRGWPGPTMSAYTRGTYTLPRHGILPWNHKPGNLIVRDVNSLQALYDFAYKRGNSVRVFGWELEIESTADGENIGERAADINESHGGNLFYCKSDSSIRNGYEVVSHPATFDYWAGPGREILEELFTQLAGWGYTSWKSGRCGLHIHTNRSTVSRLHTFNLARYMHDRNCTAKLKKLSGRTEHQMDGYAKLSLTDLFNRSRGEYDTPTSLEYAKQVRHGPLLGDKGRALNMSSRETIELRLFRGSLSMDRFMSSLQFYRTMLEFTSPTGGHLPITAKSKWLDYRNYIEDYNQPKAVKELKARLQEAGI